MIAHFQQRIEALYGQERRKNKLGLDGTRDLLRALGDPHMKFRSVHVAGTNGKGTTCALIERVLREAGYRTGLFTSPHLVDFRERIRVSGRWVDDAWLDEKLTLIESLPEGQDRTFFEVATALGFLYFAEQAVEIAVVEVGLGGRLDCTNVITPEVSVITTIGLDHTEILGKTVEEIAREKAGIIKPGVPVVVGRDIGGKARWAIEEVALEQGTSIPYLLPEFRVRPEDRIQSARPGPPHVEALNEFILPFGKEYEWLTPWGERFEPLDESLPTMLQENQTLALTALGCLVDRGIAIPFEAVKTGFVRAHWPGRFERCPGHPRLWWDAAHNAQAFRGLGLSWADVHSDHRGRVRPPGAVVLALSRDKNAESVVTELRWAFKPLKLVVTRSRSGRAMEPEIIARVAESQGITAQIVPEVVAALRQALDATGDDDVLLCGSIFAVGEAMEAFGGAPGEFQ